MVLVAADAGRDIHGVADQRELELASPPITTPLLIPMPMRSAPIVRRPRAVNRAPAALNAASV